MAVCPLLLLVATVVIVAQGDELEKTVLSQAGGEASPESKSRHILGEERASNLDSLYGTYGTQRHDEPLRSRSFGGTKRVTQFIVTGPGKRLGGAENPSIAASTPVGSQAASPSDATSAAQTEPSALIGEPCSSNASCLVANSECVEGECRCLTNHITFGSAACLRRSNFLGDTCYVTQQCTHLHNVALCYQGRCLCEPIYYVAGRACTPSSTFDYDAFGQGGVGTTSSGPASSCSRKAKVGQTCCDNNQCRYNVWNSHCRAGTCQCDSGYVNIGNQMCVRFASALGDACSVDAQCAQIANSECDQNGTCACRSRFTPRIVATARRLNKRQTSTNVCLPLRNLGESCEISGQCDRFTRNAVCTNSVCACANSFVARSPQVNECLPTIATLNGGPCSISSQCTFAGTFCNSTSNTCACNTRLFCESGGVCLAKGALGSTCTNACQCTTTDAICSTTCQCPSDTLFDSALNACSPLTLTASETQYTFFYGCCPDIVRGLGVVTASPAATCPAHTVAFTGDTDGFTFETDGTITRAGGAVTTSTSTLVASLTCTSSTSLTATASVSLVADACCLEAPAALVTNAITITLVDGVPATPTVGCAGTLTVVNADPTSAPQIALNANNIINIRAQTTRTSETSSMTLDLFTSPGPCGSQVSVTSVTLGAACSSDSFAIDSMQTVDFTHATELAAGAMIVCPVDIVLAACNGQTLAQTFTLTVMCPVTA